MTYPAAAVANFFYGLSQHGTLDGEGRFRRDRVFSGVEVSQLVYAAHGVRLAVYDEPLVSEPVVAIEAGPIIPSLFFGLADRPVDEPLNVFDVERGQFISTFCPDADDETARAALVAVWERYERASCEQIVRDTMGEGSPWRRLSTAPGFVSGAVIPDALTEQYFAGLVADEMV